VFHTLDETLAEQRFDIAPPLFLRRKANKTLRTLGVALPQLSRVMFNMRGVTSTKVTLGGIFALVAAQGCGNSLLYSMLP